MPRSLRDDLTKNCPVESVPQSIGARLYTRHVGYSYRDVFSGEWIYADEQHPDGDEARIVEVLETDDGFLLTYRRDYNPSEGVGNEDAEFYMIDEEPNVAENTAKTLSWLFKNAFDEDMGWWEFHSDKLRHGRVTDACEDYVNTLKQEYYANN